MRRIPLCVGLFLSLAAAWACSKSLRSADPTSGSPAAHAYDVWILRETWGVPHVFGVTDADAAFGLAYAHAEDDFATMQDSLLAARGQLASVYGRKAAANDYMVNLFRVWDVVEEKYETELSPETLMTNRGLRALEFLGADQAPFFVKCQTRPIWFDEEEIRANQEHEYRPGEEPNRR